MNIENNIYFDIFLFLLAPLIIQHNWSNEFRDSKVGIEYDYVATIG